MTVPSAQRIGRCSAGCAPPGRVLVFSLGRAAFPVDTHVHRVATGWGGSRRARPRTGRTSS